MISLESIKRLGLVSTGVALLAVGLTAGCSEEPPPQVQVVNKPTPKPPPPMPTVRTVAELMDEHRIDARVSLPEAKAPSRTEDRVAVLSFFDAFARGDHESLGKMISPADRAYLDQLVASDRWAETTGSIKRIDLQTGTSPGGEACALAVFILGSDHQPQLWYYNTSLEGYAFNAVATPPGLLDKLHGDDWIAVWHQILEEEIELALKGDEDLDVDQVLLDDEEDQQRGGTGLGGPGVSPGPGGPGVPGKRRNRPKYDRPSPGG